MGNAPPNTRQDKYLRHLIILFVGFLLFFTSGVRAAENQPPTANAASVTTPEDTKLAIKLTGKDPEKQPLTYAIVTQPAHGKVVLKGNVATYTPTANYNGKDTFTFTVKDGVLTSPAATVDITITPVNDAPIASDVPSIIYDHAISSIILNGDDVDKDNLSYIKIMSPVHGTITISGNVATYKPDQNYTGTTDSFTYKVNDGKLNSNIATVSMTLSPCPLPAKDRLGRSLNGLSCKDKAMLDFFEVKTIPLLESQIAEADNQTKIVEASFNEAAAQHALDVNPFLSSFAAFDSLLDVTQDVNEGKITDAFKDAGVAFQKAIQTYTNTLLLIDPLSLDNNQRIELNKENFELSEKLADLILNADECKDLAKDQCIKAIVKTVGYINTIGAFKAFKLDEKAIKSNLSLISNGMKFISQLKKFSIPNVSDAKINRAVYGMATSLSKMSSDMITIAYGSNKDNRPIVANAGLLIIDEGVTPFLDMMSSCYKIDKRTALTDRLKCISKTSQKGGEVAVKAASALGLTIGSMYYIGKSNEARVAEKVLDKMLMAGMARQNKLYQLGGDYFPSVDFIKSVGQSELGVAGVYHYVDIVTGLKKGETIYSIPEVSYLVQLYYNQILNSTSFDFNSQMIKMTLNNKEPGNAIATITVNSDSNGTLSCSSSKPELSTSSEYIIKLSNDPWIIPIKVGKTTKSFALTFTKGNTGSVMCNLYKESGAYIGGKTLAITGKGYDEDQDGMPYDWEVKYKLNPDDPTDAALDGDKDKLSNLDEFLHKTKPDTQDTDDDGFTDWQEVQATTDPLAKTSKPLPAPTNFRVVSTGNAQVVLAWDNVPNAVKYYICGSPNGSMDAMDGYGCPVGENFIGENVGLKTNATITGLDSTMKYYFQVVAYDLNAIQSPASNEVTVIPTISTPPTNVKATPSDAKVTVSWDAVQGATNYSICYAPETITDPDNCISASQNAVSLSNQISPAKIPNLINGTTYHFIVTAEDANGKVAHSTEATATPTKPDLTSGLVAHWSFDDCTAKDVSGNGHDGIINGSLGCVGTNNGKGVDFDGSQFITVTNTADIPLGSASRTISATVTMHHGMDSDVDQGILGYGLVQPASMFSLTYGLGDNGYDFGLWLFECQFDIFCSTHSANYIDPAKYYHLVASYNESTQLASFYINGNKIGERTLAINTGSSDVMIGNVHNGDSLGFNGVIDEARIYNRALSESEIKALYQNDGGGVDNSGWIQNPTTGHYYKALDNCGNWEQCETAAQAVGAHLVVIEDQAENDWLIGAFNVAATEMGYWIGYTDKEQEGVWKTVTGEIPTYTNWLSGEPNNGGGRENYALFMYYGTYGWNDVPRDNYYNWSKYPNTGIIERTTAP